MKGFYIKSDELSNANGKVEKNLNQYILEWKRENEP